MNYILGIDPGLTGALAWYSPKLCRLLLQDIPTKKNDRKCYLDIPELSRMIDVMADNTKCCYLERVHAFPGQGVSGVFRFGEVYGAIQGILAANFITTHTIPPQRWKKEMGLDSDKQGSLDMAIETFPHEEDMFRRKKDADRAEAALLALYGAEEESLLD